MVMLTRSSSRKAYESLENNTSSSNSQLDIVPPPWCSLAKDKRKSRKVGSESWETRSLSPCRADIYEYRDKRKLYKRKHARAYCKQRPKNKGCRKTLIYLAFLFAALALITALWMSESLPPTSLISKAIPKTNLISFFGLEHSLVQEECCSRIKYLVSELLRAEQVLRNMLRIRRTMMLPSKTSEYDTTIDEHYVHGVEVTRGKDTKEWGSKMALWGVVPLWRAAPPPHTVLSQRRAAPSDCWPFSGSRGELEFELPRPMRLRQLSIEHIRPDAALSAPKRFTLYAILSNGTWLTTIEAEYTHKGPAKQYYPLLYQNTYLQHLVLKVSSNQGNAHYTCVYRVHFYEKVNVLDFN